MNVGQRRLAWRLNHLRPQSIFSVLPTLSLAGSQLRSNICPNSTEIGRVCCCCCSLGRKENADKADGCCVLSRPASTADWQDALRTRFSAARPGRQASHATTLGWLAVSAGHTGIGKLLSYNYLTS